MSGDPYTVGDYVRLDLVVVDAGDVPDDPATITLTITLPDASTVTVPSGDILHTGVGTYRYDYETSAVGRHMATWRTTLPATTHVTEFDVIAALDVTVPHRPVYATAANYQQVTGQTPPADAIRKLANASELLDEALIGAWYETDPDTQLPTDPAVAAALARAVCWQVLWEQATGDEQGLAVVYPSMSIGSVSISRGSGSDGGGGSVWARLAPRTASTLRLCVDSRGWPLLPRQPLVWG